MKRRCALNLLKLSGIYISIGLISNFEKKKKRKLRHRTYFKLVKFMCLVSLDHSKNGVSERIQLLYKMWGSL